MPLSKMQKADSCWGSVEPRYEKTGFLPMRKNKDADQLCSSCAADQRLCFRYTDSTTPLLPKSEISGLWPSSVAVQPGLCRTWSEPEDRFSHNEAQFIS